ncbi:hypothetical protein P9112_004681 [Eukaryota sp. TZLM1-RC]
MSVSPSQDTDFFQINMREYNRDAYNTFTSTGEVAKSDEDSGSRPPSAPPPSRKNHGFKHGTTSCLLQTQNNGTRHGTTSRLFQIQQARKGFRNGTTPSSPKDTNVGSSSETSSVLKDYEELQSALDEIDDEGKELRQQIMKDGEAHLEPTYYCLFEQLPPLWKQLIKSGRNVGLQTLGHKGDPDIV